MLKLTKMKYSLIVIVFVTLMSTSSVAIIADTAPIVPIKEVEDIFSPSEYDERDYYILPPDTDYSGLGTRYLGGSGATAYYTNVQTNDYSQITTSLTYGSLPSNNILRSDDRTTPHDFFDDALYPRAVRIDSDKDPEFGQTQKNALSLHDDYSTTFFAEKNELYGGYFNTSGPFFLDIEVSNSKLLGAIFFDSEFPVGGYAFGDPETKMTYPVIPNALGLQEFMLFTNDSTLVTLTPHEWKYPTWFPSIEINSMFYEEFDQGEPWFKDESNDQLIQPDNEMFSLRMFNLSIEEGKYYRINTAFEMDEVRPGVISSPPLTSIIGADNLQVISGALDGDGLLIKARETVEITLIMFSPGEAHGSYSIFYQEMPQTSKEETRPITFNEDMELEVGIFYTFTISNPIVLRLNSTNALNYDIYIAGTDPGDWIQKSDEGFINGNWRYLPAGTYAFEVNSFTEIRFNSVPVISPSATPLSVTEESIYAIELPLIKNRINFVNISTDDELNQTIDYNVNILSKYEELVTTSSGSIVSLGNLETNGVWDAWPNNQTTIREFLPTRDHEVPILLIYPTDANNISDPVTVYSGTLSVDVNEAHDQSFEFKTFWALYNAFSGTGYTGVFIPKQTISSTASYTINSDQTIDTRQIIGIPLDLNPNTIYNVTATLIGNYSTTGSWNVTFDNELRVMGGNLKFLEIFNSFISGSNDVSVWQSELFLTVSDMSYLYFDLQRFSSAHNATLQVTLENIGAQTMDYQMDQAYNETISDYEVKSTSLLVKEIKPSEMKKATPGFELSLVFIALVISSVYATKKRRNR